MTPWLPLLLLSAAPGAPSVTLVVEGPDAAKTKQALTAATLPVEVRVAEVPEAAAPEAPLATEWPNRLAAARTAYVSAKFTECLATLEGDAAADELLATGQRLLAARLLTWRAACHTGAHQPEPARAAAEALARFQLPLPEDVASTTPDVEALLARASTDVGLRPVTKRRIDSVPSGASVELDGRPASCTTPCAMELLEGAHVLRLSADGYTPRWQVVSGEVAPITLAAADPALAAAQWKRRSARGEALDSEASVRLLSMSLRAPRLVVLTTDPLAPATQRGALAVDGALTARAHREGDPAGLLKDLLVRGKVIEEAPPLTKRWPFWLAVGVGVVGLGVATAVVVTTQRTVTHVELNP